MTELREAKGYRVVTANGTTDDDPKYQEFCEKHWLALQRFVLAMGVKRREADDVVQHCFLVLCARRDAVPPGKRRSFLFSVAARTVMAHRRKHLLEDLRRRQAHQRSGSRPTRHDDCPANRLVQKEQADSLEQAVAQLPPRMQQAIRLVYFEDRSRAETAGAMNIPLRTLYKYIQRALPRLRSTLESGSEERP